MVFIFGGIILLCLIGYIVGEIKGNNGDPGYG